MTNRFDFISLTDFLNKNPWLTEDEREQILALNDSSRDSVVVTDRETGISTQDLVDQIALDRYEIQNFYTLVATEGVPESFWSKQLRSFIRDHLSGDILQKISPLELYFDDNIRQLIPQDKMSDDTRENIRLIVSGLEPVEDKRSFSEIWNDLVSEQCWIFLDPLNQYESIRSRILIVQEMMNDDFNHLELEQWKEKFLELLFEIPEIGQYNLDDPVPVPVIREHLKLWNLELSPEARRAVENFMAGSLNNQKLRGETWWIIEVVRLINEADSKVNGESIKINTSVDAISGARKTSLTLHSPNNTSMIQITDPYLFIQAIGYEMIEGQGSIRGLYLFTKIISENQFHDPVNGTDYSWTNDVEPLENTDQHLFYNFWNQGMNYTYPSHSEKIHIPQFWASTGSARPVGSKDHHFTFATSLTLVPHLCRKDLAGWLKTFEPWLSPLLENIGASANDDMSKFSKQLSANILKYRLMRARYKGVGGTFERFGDGGVLIYACLEALSSLEDSRSGLALLLYFAKLSNPLGEHLRKNLPVMFQDLFYFENEGTFSRNSVEINATRKTIGNGWHLWNDLALRDIAAKLATADKVSLKDNIIKYSTDQFDFIKYYSDQYLHSDDVVIAEASSSTLLSYSYRFQNYIPIDQLIKKSNLDSLKTKIRDLDPFMTGRADFEDLLTLNLTGPERMAYTKAFKKAFKGKNDLSNYNISIDSSHKIESLQLELLTAEQLAQLITHRIQLDGDDFQSSYNWHMSKRNRNKKTSTDLVWEALFRKDENLAMSLLAKTIESLKKSIVERETILSEYNREIEKTGEDIDSLSLFYNFPSIHDVLAALPLVISGQHPESKKLISSLGSIADHLPKNIRLLSDLRSGAMTLLNYRLSQISVNFSEVPADDMFEAEVAPFISIHQVLINQGRGYGFENLVVDWDKPPITSLSKELQDILKDSIQFNPVSQDVLSRQVKYLLNGVNGFISDPDFNIRFHLQTAFGLPFPLSLIVKFVSSLYSQLNSEYLTADIQNQFNQMIHGFMTHVKYKYALSPENNDLFYGYIYEQNLAQKLRVPELMLIAFMQGDDHALDDIRQFDVLDDSKIQPESRPNEFMVGEMKRIITFIEDFRRKSKFESVLDTLVPRQIQLVAKLQELYGDADFLQEDDSSSFSYLDDLAKAYRLPGHKPSANSLIRMERGSAVAVTILNHSGLLQDDANLKEMKPDDEDYILVKKYAPSEYYKQILLRMSRFDTIRMPESSTAEDDSEFTAKDIKTYIVAVSETYTDFIQQMRFWLGMVYSGYDLNINIGSIISEIQSKIPSSDNNMSSWMEFSINAVSAISGDREALDRLWDFKNGKIKMQTDLMAMSNIIDELNDLNDQILFYLDSERFMTGNIDSSELNEEAVMGFVEFGKPDRETPHLEEHWINKDAASNENEKVSSHASFVAQTLLGNYGYQSMPTGVVYNCIFDGSSKQDLWTTFDQSLTKVIADIDQGVEMSVINISLGMSHVWSVGTEFDNFLASERFKELQKKIQYLKNRKIPLVISAGNDGENSVAQINSEGAIKNPDYDMETKILAFFNILGILDPAIIMVGSSTIGGYEKEYLVSQFSSHGGLLVRPDVVHIGEGFNFLFKNIGNIGNDGTSFSAPSVARLITKMKSINNHLSVEEIQAIIKSSAFDLDPASPVQEGSGHVDPSACLYMAYAFPLLRSRKNKNVFSNEIGLGTDRQRDLDYLIRRIRLPLLVKDAIQQNFGE